MRVSELVKALGTTERHQRRAGTADATITGLSVDSRNVAPGDCFVALKGTRVDATRFIPDALNSGAAFAIGGPGSPVDDRVAVVDEPLGALGTLGRLIRERFTGPVVGITGSAGKTTVKEMLRTLVGTQRRAVFPEGSHNNFEGVPRTLARLTHDTELCVAELGSNAVGEIAALCEIAQPTMGILTSIGAAHLEGLGSLGGVLREKLALARALPTGATLIINADDPHLASADYPSSLNVVRVSLGAAEQDLCPALGTRVLQRNFWLAYQAALHLGLDEGKLRENAAAVRPAALRGEVRQLGEATLILDCYNANPLSLGEAIDDLGMHPEPRAAVLGEMLELGPATEPSHREMGARLASCGVERALFIGPSGEAFADGFRTAGGDPQSLDLFATVDEARVAYAEIVRAGGTVLLKASRGVAIERLLEDQDG